MSLEMKLQRRSKEHLGVEYPIRLTVTGEVAHAVYAIMLAGRVHLVPSLAVGERLHLRTRRLSSNATIVLSHSAHLAGSGTLATIPIFKTVD